MFGFDVDSQFRLRFRICYIRCRFRLLSFDFRCSLLDVHLRCSISMFDFDFEFLIVDIDFDFNSEFEEIVRCQFRYPFFLFWISRSAFDCDVRLSVSMSSWVSISMFDVGFDFVFRFRFPSHIFWGSAGRRERCKLPRRCFFYFDVRAPLSISIFDFVRFGLRFRYSISIFNYGAISPMGSFLAPWCPRPL